MSPTRRHFTGTVIAAALVPGILGNPGTAAADAQTQDANFEPRADLPRALISNIRAFFGSAQGNYFIDNNDFDRIYPTIDQYMTAFAAPGEKRPISSDMTLISGFMPHNAGMQAAVVIVTTSNTVVAAALVHQNCRREGFRFTDPGADPVTGPCALNPAATIYLVGSENAAVVTATQALKGWAHDAIEAHRSMFRKDDPDNSPVDVINVVLLRG